MTYSVAVSIQVMELAEEIKERGRRSTRELPPLLEKAERLAEDPSLDALSRALAHRAAGNARQMLNQFRAALANYDGAIAILETLAQPEELGRTLSAKVGLLFFLSDFDQLLACADRARALFESLGDRRRLARLDVNLSHAYHRMDRYDLVLESAERALAVLEEVGDREGALAASMNSAVALTLMHEFNRSIERYRKALDLAGKLQMAVCALNCRYNISYLHYLAGDSSEALTRIGAIRSEYAAAGEQRHVCLCWLDEAEILLEIGDLHNAKVAAQNANALARELGLNFEIGKSLLFEAVVALRLGDPAESEPLLEEGSRRFQDERNGVWAAVAKLQTLLVLGNSVSTGSAGALSEAIAAKALLANSGLPHRLAFADIVIGRLYRTLGDLDKSIDSLRSGLNLGESGQSTWMQFHAAHELGVSLLERDPIASLGLFKRADAMLDSLWNRLGGDDLKLAFLNDRENLYTHMVGLTLENSVDTAFELSEKSRSRVLRERLNVGALPLEAMQSRIVSDEILVEYFVSGNDVTVFTLTRDALNCVQLRDVIGSLRAHCDELDRHFLSCSVKWERLEAAKRQLSLTAEGHLRAIYDILIAPIAHGLRRRITIVPHSFLHAIPFHALSNGTTYIADAHELAYSPSAALYCSPSAEQPLGTPLFLAFSTGGKTTAVEEVEEAAGSIRDACVAVNPSIGELRRLLETPRQFVHIAGHAGIDAIGGTLSWIETSEGRLTGRDLTGMAIRTRTLVITGCRTARRTICPGDEWQGLMRAFYLSGASTIVSAFWDIRDQSARRFASKFYEHFRGDNAPAAVRAASRAVRDWNSHPYFWAGFGAFVRQGSGISQGDPS